jgi:hypothetical protein
MPFEKPAEPFFTPETGALRSAPLVGPPQLPASLPLKTACRIVRQMTAELVMLLGDRILLRRDRRRFACHVRQIAMYVCHVSLQVSLSDIGQAFGRDRTTVGHACHVVEDRRDDPAFDDFVSTVERLVTTVFGLAEVPAYE